MGEPALLKGAIPVEGASLAFSHEAEGLFLIIGRWYVEVKDGKLIVRGAQTPEVVLTVDV